MNYLMCSKSRKFFPKFMYLSTFLVIFLIWWCTYITDLYYFYLWWESFNIVVYILLMNLSYNLKNYKAVLAYFLIRFISSLLFLISLYDMSHNSITSFLLIIALTLKLGLYPFSHLMSKIYDEMSYLAFLSTSSFLYFHYILLLIKANTLYYVTFNRFDYEYTYIIILVVLLASLIFAAYLMDKIRSLKAFWAVSSLSNLPMIVITILSNNYITDGFATDEYFSLLRYLV